MPGGTGRLNAVFHRTVAEGARLTLEPDDGKPLGDAVKRQILRSGDEGFDAVRHAADDGSGFSFVKLVETAVEMFKGCCVESFEKGGIEPGLVGAPADVFGRRGVGAVKQAPDVQNRSAFRKAEDAGGIRGRRDGLEDDEPAFPSDEMARRRFENAGTGSSSRSRCSA